MNRTHVVRTGLWLACGTTTFLVGCQSSLYSIAVQGTSLSIQSLVYTAVAQVVSLFGGTA